MPNFNLRGKSAILLTACTAAFLILTSSDNGGTGVNNAAANGTNCGPCHGNTASPNTTISFSGVPANGYTPGTSYPVTMIINNATMPKCGFSLFVTGGTLSSNPSGTTLTPVSLNQIRHNIPLSMNSGVYTCNFNWIAPTTGGTVTVKVVANAVNGNGNDDVGDQWNTAQFTLTQAPNAVSDIHLSSSSVFPNPVTNILTINTSSDEEVTQFAISNLAGQRYNLPFTKQPKTISISVEQLPVGYYQLSYMQNGIVYRSSFLKK
jgi:hypothetical protein